MPGFCQEEFRDYGDTQGHSDGDTDERGQHGTSTDEMDEDTEDAGVVEEHASVRKPIVRSQSTEKGSLFSKIYLPLLGAAGSFALSSVALPELTEEQENAEAPLSVRQNVQVAVGFGALAAALSLFGVSAYRTGKYFLRRRGQKGAVAGDVSSLEETDAFGPSAGDQGSVEGGDAEQ
ncbi:dense granule protein GRA7 [Besnoitia besnoiti]|uniref:Dense granule protein GRA7 n=1 Tax=Besnoitia besnoiti TaxID=94643 RepID=A0A2A9M7U5_BESBE|nr:dense granule protein GRA7 [Besnoitia besnoiti]PFH34558.1 dense granule protein GRA7 [Besnoitia besnoiti]